MYNECDSLTTQHKKNSKWVDMPLKSINQSVKEGNNILDR